jgi:lipid-A-disaccharide synthase
MVDHHADPALAVGMVAGERSGDLLAASVLEGLRQACSAVDAAGVGGPAMRAQGFTCWADIERLSVMGYAEVLKRLPSLLALRARLARRLPGFIGRGVFVGIDAPDFNLGLEERLRRAGVRTIHFVSPSIWAWRRERIDRIRRAVDHMLLVFPFEKAIYDTEGIPATYVGHPLADARLPVPDPRPARQRLGLAEGEGAVIALLPGSRADEIRHLGPCFIDTALELHRRRPDLRFLIPAATAAIHQRLRQIVAGRGLPADLSITLVSGQSHRVMAAADVVLVASGTATLEAALIGRPMVIAYRMGALNYRMMRDRGYLPWIGLPNILAGESLVPEFIQDQAQPRALADALMSWLDAPAAVERLRERFAELGASLRQGCAARSAAAILAVARA